METLTVAEGDLTSNPLIYAATRIDDALERMDDEVAIMFKSHAMNTINSWYRLPIYDADFRWGRPIFMGPGPIGFPGLAILIPDPIDDGSQSWVISLELDHMGLFKKYLYDIEKKEMNPIRETSSIFGNMELLDLVRHLNEDCGS
ncbi:shikimate O-hydroxycinnamoyltransferase-like protein isoform X1 [Cinnamomum micranthum f. kanehirae]|uniref:Shikimate O-hydroxycinnamoyltransferase-like protein isoform X1 n=1 Tax=Cinnamomum micranthum f. kanehirae TaxID=337451 RepID=A0A3S3QVM4_9MAGN|nr:shikimate O-hydroxycinnamoyltransferase-like protein isoform X1 [Cinnamomum micranthum f. kanehirae]